MSDKIEQLIKDALLHAVYAAASATSGKGDFERLHAQATSSEAALLSAIRELQEDAERYRWLLRNNGRLGNPMRPMVKVIHINSFGDETDVDDLKKFIDAARKQEGK